MPELLELIAIGFASLGALIFARDSINEDDTRINEKTIGMMAIFLGFLLPAGWIAYDVGKEVSEFNGILMLFFVLYVYPLLGLGTVYYRKRWGQSKT